MALHTRRRGRVIGGSSSVNTAIALRGIPEDYDEWASFGNGEWAWEKLLPFFRLIEHDRDFADDFHLFAMDTQYEHLADGDDQRDARRGAFSGGEALYRSRAGL